jgi:branched-chain amino acid transport system substrate-binding protein
MTSARGPWTHRTPASAAAGRRRLVVLAGAATLGLPALRVAAAEPGVGDSEIVIGQSITLQAGRNAYGGDALAGIKLRLDEANLSGGVGSRRIVLRTLDDNNDSSLAEANARQLVKDGAFILFGSIEGGASTAVMKAAVDLNVPFFGPMAGSPGLRRPHQPLVFPVRAEHREEFRALILHGQRLGYRRVALLHADSAVGREHLANVQMLAGEARLGFGGGLPFRSDITDPQIDAIVAQVTQGQVDLVLNHGSASVYQRLIRRARAAGSRAAYWGVNSGSTPLAAALGPLAHGMVFAQIMPNPRSGKTAVARQYQAAVRKAGGQLPPSYGSLEGYVTASALLAALRAAGPTPTRATLLAALQNFDADLGGLSVRYRKGEHTGCHFVDLSLVGSDGRFIQ